jgi:hypothetical protein
MKSNRPITIALASVLVMSTAIPVSALAQYRRSDPAPAPAQTYEQWLEQQEDYRREQREYEEARRAWQERESAYQRRQASYQERREDYERRRAQWERDRADYDRRYGYGAYVRRYGEWRYDPDGRYADNRGGYDRDGRGGRDYYADWRDERCERREDRSQVVGGLIGALAGAAIGSNVAATNSQTEGALLGAVVGGAIGANIGEKAAECDDDGYYYTYAQTYEYREPRYRSGVRSGRYERDWYVRNRCRLAVAPTEYGGRTDYRYVRVCPDRRGRYRITS